MSKEASFLSMQQAILRYINSRIPKDKNCAQLGIIRGGAVTIGNKKYSASLVNDMYFGDGDQVVCLIPDTGGSAAVIGKV